MTGRLRSLRTASGRTRSKGGVSWVNSITVPVRHAHTPAGELIATS